MTSHTQWDSTQKDKYTDTHIHKYNNISYMLIGAICLNHWMNNSLISKFYLAQNVYKALFFENYSLAKLTYLQIILSKILFFLGNTKKTDTIRKGFKNENKQYFPSSLSQQLPILSNPLWENLNHPLPSFF